jgi:hypothetical protein
MTQKTRLFISVAVIAGMSSISNLVFVFGKLPVIFWPSLIAGIFGAAVTVFFIVLLH